MMYNNTKLKQFKQGKTGVIIVALVALAIVLYLLLAGGSGDEVTPPENGDTTETQTFESEEYGFSIEIPQDWEIATSSEESITARFVFYQPPVEGDGERPYDHFVNDTYVGVYPEGIPTEGLLGTRGSITQDLPLLDITQESQEYTLEDDTPFAWQLKFTNPPTSWRESGYVWGRAEVSNLETVCMQDGEEVSMNACDIPMEEGAEIVRRGSVDSSEWNTVTEVIQSIEFNTN